MTRAEIRRLGHEMLTHVEWLDRHIKTRNGKDTRHLEGVMADLNKFALKLIDAPLRLVEEPRDADDH